MELIEPEVKLLSELGITPESHIARCARVCYGREYKEPNQEADKKMVEGLIKRGHLSMLRHASMYFSHTEDISQIATHIANSCFWNYDVLRGYASTNLQEFMQSGVGKGKITVIDNKQFLEDCAKHPRLFELYRLTFCITTQISTSRELNRVSPNAIAERSTRYIKSSTKSCIDSFDFTKEQDIVNAYLQGNSIKAISRRTDISHHKVRELLVNNGITIRPTRGEIWNEESFKNIDSPEKAYLLGIIETDGSVRKSHNELSITQHQDYYLYIQAIVEYVLGNAPHVSNDRQCKKLNIINREIVDDLIDMGIVENKTYLQNDKDMENLLSRIPKQYINSFYRGLIDGDGYLSYGVQSNGSTYQRVGFSVHTICLAKHIQDTISRITGAIPTIRKDGELYHIDICQKERVITFSKWLYKDFKYPFGHPKKVNRFMHFLKTQDSFVDYPTVDFGDDRFCIGKPHWYDSASSDIKMSYLLGIYSNEISYRKLILDGMKPEDARGVLPLDTATKVIYTYSVQEWKHILDLRYYGTTGKPHPNCHVVMQMVKDQINSFAKEHNIDYQV